MANTAAKRLKWDNNPVQVESAIRDGTGKVISTDCVRHAEFPIDTDDATTSVAFSTLALGSSWDGIDGHSTVARIPRLVQVFEENGNEVGVDFKIDTSQSKIDVYLVGAPANKTWTVRVTAW